MGTSPPFNEPPGSPLSTGRSGVNSRGQRSQDHRLHNASDCWLLMLRRAQRGGVRLCVFVCVYVCICLIVCVFVCLCVWAYVRARVRVWASVFLHASWHVYVCAHACQRIVCKRRNLIGRTTVADETWWTAGSLSSCWWGFGSLSLRGEIEFPPPARRRCLDSLARDWRGCVTLQITQSLRLCWESGVWSAACHDSTQEECGTVESCQSVCQPASTSVSPFISISFTTFEWAATCLFTRFPFGHECFIRVLILSGQCVCKSNLYWRLLFYCLSMINTHVKQFMCWGSLFRMHSDTLVCWFH